jgi:alkylation response protein AidB-like acyl-CoA dehydrogenase
MAEVVVTKIDWVARAKLLQPMLNAAGPRCDAESELPTNVVEALHDAGLFRLLIPLDLEGAEVDLRTFSAVIEAVAEGDGSAAWCLGQNAVSNMTSAYMPPDEAQRMFSDRRIVLAWGAGVNGQAIPAEGGFRVSGRWGFASGSRHATWLGGQAPIKTPDGSQSLELDGSPSYRTFVFPKASCQVTVGWDAIGLRGTGSDSYEVSDVFVPNAYLFKRTVPAPHPGALYRIPLAAVYPIAFASVAVGLARAILGAFIDMARNKVPQGLIPMRDSDAIQSLLGHAATRLNSARINLHHTLGEIYGMPMDNEREIGLRGNTTFAIHEALAVADILFHEAGATAILVNQPFARRLRDIHAVAQQVQARRANFELVGKRLLGFETGPLFL